MEKKENNNMLIIGSLISAIILIAVGFVFFTTNSTQEDNQETQNTNRNNQQDNSDNNQAINNNSNNNSNNNDDSVDMQNDNDSMDSNQNANSSAGEYVNYGTKSLTSEVNILFFHANWCPSCQATNRDINDNLDNIPSNVTIFKTDYDTETNLKDKYGVTYQHTFVQVDSEGNEIKQWGGSFSLDDILENI